MLYTHEKQVFSKITFREVYDLLHCTLNFLLNADQPSIEGGSSLLSMISLRLAFDTSLFEPSI